MNPPLNDTLRQVAEETFESLAFMFAMPEDEDADDEQIAWVGASVEFVGPFTGTVAIALAEPMLSELTANMVGADDPSDVPPEQQTDGLKELANVVCGNLLPALAGAEALFDVRAPVLLDRGEIPEHVDGLNPASRIRLCLDSGPAEVALFTPEPIVVVAETL